MAKVDVHHIKNLELAKKTDTNGTLADVPINRRLAMGEAFLSFEGRINDLACMARLSNEYVANFDFKSHDREEANTLVFAVYHLRDMSAELLKKYYEETTRARAIQP